MLKIKRDKQFRETKRELLYSVFKYVTIGAAALFVILQIFGKFSKNNLNNDIAELTSRNQRSILEFDPDDALSDYPEQFSDEDLQNGAWLLHLVGVFYMFVAIAIVSDEFFVPTIEVIVEKLNMSPDTAGATFMAAGGSAPELFTSFIGTFTESSVGFSTIVGSAVFNVLFVIGCCAIFSSGDLVLTWYPFARDCIYYMTSLLILALFFGVATPDEIYWWEALILLALYGGYCVLMMNNAKLFEWIQSRVPPPKNNQERARAASQLRVTRPLNFTVSLFDILVADAKIEDIAGIHMVARIKGDVKATFRQVDTDGNNIIDREEFRAVIGRLGKEVTDEELDRCFKELDENDDGTIDFAEFEKWYLRSEARMETDIRQIFERFDHNANGNIGVDELKNLLIAVHQANDETDINVTDEEVENARKLLDKNSDGEISEQEFVDWYKSSIFFDKAVQRRNTLVEEEAKQEESRESGGLDLKFPDNTRGRITFILVAPIVYPLAYTVPDVRTAKGLKYYPFAFIASIIWLGIYSWLMVWWATVVGVSLGIDIAILGLTLLAAGTSVPDLLTSIIVARHGEGDMAVSSSIGSNIFDVLVGLPMPWFFYSIYQAILGNAAKTDVVADSLAISIFVLFLMLAAVLGTIKCNHWRMTKRLGYVMFVFYALFVTQDLLRTYNIIDV